MGGRLSYKECSTVDHGSFKAWGLEHWLNMYWRENTFAENKRYYGDHIAITDEWALHQRAPTLTVVSEAKINNCGVTIKQILARDSAKVILHKVAQG